MSSEVDYYDVQAMIRDARSEIRGEIANAVDEACHRLRAEHDDYAESVDAALAKIQDSLRATDRVLASRTEHLA